MSPKLLSRSTLTPFILTVAHEGGSSLFWSATEIHGAYYLHFRNLDKGLVFTTSNFQKSWIEIIQLSRKIPPTFLKFNDKQRKMG
jgi:hypothetical protein